MINNIKYNIKSPVLRTPAVIAGEGIGIGVETAVFYGGGGLIHGEDLTLEGFAHAFSEFTLLKASGRVTENDYIKKTTANKLNSIGLDIELTKFEKNLLKGKGHNVRRASDISPKATEEIFKMEDVPFTTKMKLMPNVGVVPETLALERATTLKGRVSQDGDSWKLETRLDSGELIEVKHFDNKVDAVAESIEIANRMRYNNLSLKINQITSNGDFTLKLHDKMGDKMPEFEKAIKETEEFKTTREITPESRKLLSELDGIVSEVYNDMVDAELQAKPKSKYSKSGVDVTKEEVSETIKSAKELKDIEGIKIDNDAELSRQLETKSSELNEQRKPAEVEPVKDKPVEDKPVEAKKEPVQDAVIPPEVAKEAKESFDAAIKEGKMTEEEAATAARSNLERSEWYKTMEDKAVASDMIDKAVENMTGGKRVKKSPEMPAREKDIKTSISDRVRMEARAARDAVSETRTNLENLTKSSTKENLDNLSGSLERAKQEGNISDRSYRSIVSRIGKTNVNDPASVARTISHTKKIVRKAEQKQVSQDLSKGISEFHDGLKIKTTKKGGVKAPKATPEHMKTVVAAESIIKSTLEQRKSGKNIDLGSISDNAGRAVSNAMREYTNAPEKNKETAKSNLDKAINEQIATQYASNVIEVGEISNNLRIDKLANNVASGRKIGKKDMEFFKQNKEAITELGKEKKLDAIAENMFDKKTLSKEDKVVYSENKEAVDSRIKILEEYGVLEGSGSAIMRANLDRLNSINSEMIAMNEKWAKDYKDKVEREAVEQHEKHQFINDEIRSRESRWVREPFNKASSMFEGESNRELTPNEVDNFKSTLKGEIEKTNEFKSLSKKKQDNIISKIDRLKGKNIYKLRDNARKAVNISPETGSAKKHIKFRTIGIGVENFQGVVDRLSKTAAGGRALNEEITKPYAEARRNWEKVAVKEIESMKKIDKVLTPERGSVKEKEYGIVLTGRDGKAITELESMSIYQMAELRARFNNSSDAASIEAKYGEIGATQLEAHLEKMAKRYPVIDKLRKVGVSEIGEYAKFQDEIMMNEFGTKMKRAPGGEYLPRKADAEIKFENSQLTNMAPSLNNSLKPRVPVNNRINLVDADIRKTTKGYIDGVKTDQFYKARKNMWSILNDKAISETIKSGGKDGEKVMSALKLFYENVPNPVKKQGGVLDPIKPVFNNLKIAPLMLPNVVPSAGQALSGVNFSVEYPGAIGATPIIKHPVALLETAVRSIKDRSLPKQFWGELWSDPMMRNRLNSGFDRDVNRFNEGAILKQLGDKAVRGETKFKEAMMTGIKYGDASAWIGAYPTWLAIRQAEINKGSAPQDANKIATEKIVQMGQKAQQSYYAENLSGWQFGNTSDFFPYFTTPLQHQQQVFKGMREIKTGATYEDRARGMSRVINYAVMQPLLYTGSRFFAQILKLNDEQWEKEKNDLMSLYDSLNDENKQYLIPIAVLTYGFTQGLPAAAPVTNHGYNRILLGKDYDVEYSSSSLLGDAAGALIKTIETATTEGGLNNAMDNEKEMNDLIKNIAISSQALGLNGRAILEAYYKISQGTTAPDKDVKKVQGVKTSASTKKKTSKKL